MWRHRVGSPAADDVIVIEENDQRFNLGVGLTRSERYVCMTIASSLTSEVWLLDAATPAAAPRVVLPRRQGVEYSVEHQAAPAGQDGDGRLLILHNDGALNFELAQVPLRGSRGDGPLAGAADLTTVIAHRADTRLLSADAFASQVVVYARRDGNFGHELYITPVDGPTEKEPVRNVTRYATWTGGVSWSASGGAARRSP